MILAAGKQSSHSTTCSKATSSNIYLTWTGLEINPGSWVTGQLLTASDMAPSK